MQQESHHATFTKQARAATDQRVKRSWCPAHDPET